MSKFKKGDRVKVINLSSEDVSNIELGLNMVVTENDEVPVCSYINDLGFIDECSMYENQLQLVEEEEDDYYVRLTNKDELKKLTKKANKAINKLKAFRVKLNIKNL